MAYVNPVSGLSGLQIGRIDQGVDFHGNGPIAAIGSGQVVQVYSGNSGWPGLGGWVSYRLSDGPAAGQIVYVAEDVQPSVSTGQTISQGQVIGQMHDTGTGIETGWASQSGSDTTLARDYGGYSEGDHTALGDNFDQLLVSLGVHASPGLGHPNRGSVPSGFPNWGSNSAGGTSGLVPGVQGVSNIFSPSDWFSAIASSLGVPDIKDAAQRLALIFLGFGLLVMGLLINTGQAAKLGFKTAKEPLDDAGKAIGLTKGNTLTKQTSRSLKAAGGA